MWVFEVISPPWRITAYFVVAFMVGVFLAKLVSALRCTGSTWKRAAFLLFAPALSVETWERTTLATRSDFMRVVKKSLVLGAGLVAIYAWFPDAISRPGVSWTMRGYLSVIPFWVLTEGLGTITQLVYLGVGLAIPPLHDRPWRARTLGEFWGRRWNRPLSDWFREVCFRPLRRRPVVAVGLAFAASGVLHEWVVNLPLWLAYGTNRFASMFIYFMLQAAGVLLERKLPGRRRGLRRAVAWLVVLAPIPLVLNEGTLRISHLVR